MTSILETKPGHTDFHLFADLPKRIYRAGSPRHLMPEHIPEDFLKTCYLLLDGGRPVARASVYDNPLLTFRGQHAFALGNYECEDDPAYAHLLLSHISSAVRYEGGEYLIGPMNGSTWENYRFAASHDNPLFFTEPYYHLYYNQHFADAGFEPIAQYYSNIDRHMQADHPAISKREQELREQGVKIRPIDLLHFGEEIERIYAFNNIAFRTNFLYTPIDQEAFIRKYTQTKKYIDPAFTLVAEDADENLIGYYFCLHDFLNPNEKSLIVKTLARHPDPRWSGLGHVIGNIVYRKAIEQGYTSAIHSFIYQQGTSTKLSAAFSGVNYRDYVLYGKKLL
jgi:L-amino acid N-acyltransferase YncA